MEHVSTFLFDGGFTSIHKNEAEKQESEKEKEMLNLGKLRYDVKNARRVFKTYWWTFGISILGFLLALGKIVFE